MFRIFAPLARAQARIRCWSNTNTLRRTSQYGTGFSRRNLFGLRGSYFIGESFRPMSRPLKRMNCHSFACNVRMSMNNNFVNLDIAGINEGGPINSGGTMGFADAVGAQCRRSGCCCAVKHRGAWRRASWRTCSCNKPTNLKIPATKGRLMHLASGKAHVTHVAARVRLKVNPAPCAEEPAASCRASAAASA